MQVMAIDSSQFRAAVLSELLAFGVPALQGSQNKPSLMHCIFSNFSKSTEEYSKAVSVLVQNG
jgi:hypothetical protein